MTRRPDGAGRTKVRGVPLNATVRARPACARTS